MMGNKESDFCKDCGRSLVTQSFFGMTITSDGVSYKDGDVCRECDKKRLKKVK